MFYVVRSHDSLEVDLHQDDRAALVRSVESTHAYQHSLVVLSFHLSQLPGYEVQQNTLLVPNNRTVVDLYRDLQLYTLDHRYIDCPEASSLPSPYPRIHVIEFSRQSLSLNDLVGIFTIVSLMLFQTLHPMLPVLQYAFRLRYATLRVPFAAAKRQEGLLNSYFDLIFKLVQRARPNQKPYNVDLHSFNDLVRQIDLTLQMITGARRNIIFSITEAMRGSLNFHQEVCDYINRFQAYTGRNAVQYRHLATHVNEVVTRVHALECRERMRQQKRRAKRKVRFVVDLMHLLAFQVTFMVAFVVLFTCIIRFKPSTKVSRAVIGSSVVYDGGMVLASTTSPPLPSSTLLSDLPLPPFSRGDGYRIALI